MAVAVFLTIDNLLTDTGLHIFINVRIVEPEKKAVGPGLVDKTDFTDDGFIVICVVETLDMLFLATVDGSRLEILNRGIDPVIIVRIVLESIYLILETVSEGLAEVDV